MCTVEAESIITDVVTELVNDDALFTAFDVTKKVQALLNEKKLPNERHRDLKRRIHEEVAPYVSQGLYDQQLTDVGAPTKAFLYLPSGADPNAYTPQPRTDGQEQQSPPTPQPAASPAPQPVAASAANTTTPQSGPSISLVDADDGDEVDKAGRETDKRGSLTIPCFLLKAAGFATGDIAYVTTLQWGESFAVSKRPVAGKAPLGTTYTVNSNVNVRVTASSLTACGLSPQSTFDFERQDDQVIVTRHTNGDNDQDD